MARNTPQRQNVPHAHADSRQNPPLAERRRGNCRSLRRAIIVTLLLLCGYVAVIQVLPNQAWQESSMRQQRRMSYISAKRGAILDRNGRVLNYSIPEYDLAIRIDAIRDPRDTRNATLNKCEAAISSLAVFLGSDYYMHRPRRESLEKHINTAAPLPFVVWTNLGQEELTLFSEHRNRFPFAEIIQTWHRGYDYDNTAAQVRGFTHLAPSPKANWRLLNYRQIEGVAGIEKLLETTLAGESGSLLLETDVMAYRHRTVDVNPAVPGQNVELTLDIQWQKSAEKALEKTKCPGAVVIMDVTNGEILVMASTPQNSLPPQNTDARLNGAFLNRCTAGYYPPGSTMKPLIALLALENGIVSPTEKLYCPGYYELPNGKRIACTSKHGHGYLTLSQALAASCNAYFCELGVRLGKDGFSILDSSPKFKLLFGQRTGVTNDAEEIAGVRFAPEWIAKHRTQSPQWLPGDSANAAIGQGAWIVTPIQLAVYACAITTGRVFRPTLVKDATSHLINSISWPDAIWVPVLQGMIDCIETDAGTGRRLRNPKRMMYAKTGTAEYGKGKSPHAWMFAVYPAEKPKYAVVCVVEGGGHGGITAAQVLKDVLPN